MAKHKVVSLAEAVSHIPNGASIMIAGFMNRGAPETLIRGIREADIKDLNVISGNAGTPGRGIGALIREKRIRHIACTHIGKNKEAIEQYIHGQMDIEFIPMGTMAERIRAGGAGIGGILTPTGLGTPVEEGKQIVELNGKRYLVEAALHADVSIIHAWKADTLGNCVYYRTGKNWNPIMATAGDLVIVEADEIVEPGTLDLDAITTPGCLVDFLVQSDPIVTTDPAMG